jgi:hypothetical protein
MLLVSVPELKLVWGLPDLMERVTDPEFRAVSTLP